MASCVLFTPKHDEGQQLLQALHDRAAYLTDQDLDCKLFQSMQGAITQLRIHQTKAIAWDVEENGALAALSEVRPYNQDAFLLIVASPDISPLMFLRPEIAPSSLIFRPLSPTEVNRVACEMLRSIYGNNKGCFVIERRGERQQIPWEQIYYFESREKKLFVRLRNEEIGFSGVLETLSETLPDSFQRCHRGFIVNMEKIDKVRFAENYIVLWDGLIIPLSRGYKRDIKERIGGRI